MRESYKGFDSMKIFEWLDTRYRKRQAKEKKLQIMYGNREKKDKLYRIDKMLEYSGIKRKLWYVNAEIFLAFMFLIMIVMFFAGVFVTKKIFAGIIASGISLTVIWLLIYFRSGKYYLKLEENLMTLLNLIDNFNKTEDDIVQIFKKTIAYVDEPLKGLLQDFCSEVKASGDVNQAFDNLGSKIEHKKCRLLIRNLQVCARYETNYSLVVKDLRSSMIDYLAIKAERKAIIANGRAELVILLISAALIISLFANITGDIKNLLFNSFIGNVMLIYCAVVALICIVVMFLFDKNGG